MSSQGNVIKGAIKINGLPDGQCFTSFEDLLRAFPKLFSIELPSSATNVVISATQPGEDEKDKIWYRIDPSGNFIAPYIFVKGQWRIAYVFAPNQVIWIYGDSRTPPDGFILIDNAQAIIPSSVVGVLQAQYIFDTSATFYVYFTVLYVGY